jgi:toxin HigB-1
VSLEVEFDDPDLDRLEIDPSFTAGWERGIVRGFRKVMQAIRAAADERDFYASKGLHFEKLKPPREHQRSFRINKQWRLIVELRGKGTEKIISIIKIEDYH